VLYVIVISRKHFPYLCLDICWSILELPLQGPVILKTSKGTKNPLEASYGHLLESFSHDSLQKVEGYVIGLIPLKKDARLISVGARESQQLSGQFSV
jgi:hypothetical protein